MARSSKRTGKIKAVARATPRKKSVGAKPRAPVVKAPVVRVSHAEALAEARSAFSRMVAKAWAGLTVLTLPAAGSVSLRAVRSTRERPHWHLLTDGLLSKGFELSVRVPAQKEELAPPLWAVELVASLVRRVGQPGGAVGEGQSVSLGAPLEATLGQEMQAVALGIDPHLGTIDTPHLERPVLVAVGITLDEERLVREWSPSGLLEVMAQADPLLLTDLDRASLLLAPRARSIIEQRAEREGSSMGAMWARVSTAEQTKKGITWTLSAEAIDPLVSLLKGRLGHQRPFAVQAEAFTVDVQPGDAPPQLEKGVLHLRLSQTTARAMRSTLRAKPGRYSWDVLPNFLLEAVSQKLTS